LGVKIVIAIDLVHIKMKVFKFGGASLKSSNGIRQVGKIVASTSAPLLVVVSAMGKTTDQLEKVHTAGMQGRDYSAFLKESKAYHHSIISGLFKNSGQVISEVENQFDELEKKLDAAGDFDCIYDQVVSFGENISSLIVYNYMLENGISLRWLDARTCIKTDRTFREGKVDWDETQKNIQEEIRNGPNGVIITQGFIGGTRDGLTTTLGREGSDFTAAIFAFSLNAESVTIWKDVPGVMNADPKRLPAATVFRELPFKEAAEMTYYGASVIHPKTIKPLANKGIPLLVKNFDDPSLPGTRIHECKIKELPPLIVFLKIISA
jgi:aspartate kinase